MFRSAVMPEHVISGAARFQDILLGSPDLAGEAVAAGVLSYGVWGVAALDGSYRVGRCGELPAAGCGPIAGCGACSKARRCSCPVWRRARRCLPPQASRRSWAGS